MFILAQQLNGNGTGKTETDFCYEFFFFMGDDDIQRRKTPAQRQSIELFSGMVAGLISTLVCAPLDIAKTRLQVQGSLGLHSYSGNTVRIIAKIFVDEGIPGLFRGVGPALFTLPLFLGIYWPIYNSLKTFLPQEFPSINIHLSHLLAAISGEAIASIVTSPFWVIRTRIQTQFLHQDKPQISTIRMIKKMYKDEGMRSFYRGLGASFLGLIHPAIQFPLCKLLSFSGSILPYFPR
jgi:solute carrier family 25 folate transporter 32